MSRFMVIAPFALLLVGCGRQYRVIGESDTSDPIAVSIMKLGPTGHAEQIYYTELTGNDTEFVFDQRIPGDSARIEAWFELKGRPARATVFAIPPDRPVRLKVDTDDDAVVIEETRYGGVNSRDD